MLCTIALGFIRPVWYCEGLRNLPQGHEYWNVYLRGKFDPSSMYIPIIHMSDILSYKFHDYFSYFFKIATFFGLYLGLLVNGSLPQDGTYFGSIERPGDMSGSENIK